MRHKKVIIFLLLVFFAGIIGFYLNTINTINESKQIVKDKESQHESSNTTCLGVKWVRPRQGEVVERRHSINVAVYPPSQKVKAKLILKPEAKVMGRAPGWVPGKALVYSWHVIAEPGEYTATVELTFPNCSNSFIYTWNYIVK